MGGMDPEALADGLAVHAPSALDFLRLSEQDMFNRHQRDGLNALEKPKLLTEDIRYPASLYIILKATRLCNLRCSYCNAWREGPNQVISFELLAKTIQNAMSLPGIRWLHIVWHGGETTLLSRRYFERAIWLQEHFRVDDRRVEHSIQTNATLLNEAWCRFFKATGFSVGVSLDFNEKNHDRHRRFKDGSGSYADARRGVDLLEKFEIPHGWLAVVDEQVMALGARGLLEGLLEQNVATVGFLNALPANDESSSPMPYLPWDRFVEFLRDVFRLWKAEYRDKITIRELDSLYRIVGGSDSRLCIYQGGCMGQYLTVEPDGVVSACDKYVGDEAFRFGSLATQSLQEILVNNSSLEQVRSESDALLSSFSLCANYKYCRGGCPHDARLNLRHGISSNCCGLYDLIEDMKEEER